VLSLLFVSGLKVDLFFEQNVDLFQKHLFFFEKVKFFSPELVSVLIMCRLRVTLSF